MDYYLKTTHIARIVLAATDGGAAFGLLAITGRRPVSIRLVVSGVAEVIGIARLGHIKEIYAAVFVPGKRELSGPEIASGHMAVAAAYAENCRLAAIRQFAGKDATQIAISYPVWGDPVGTDYDFAMARTCSNQHRSG